MLWLPRGAPYYLVKYQWHVKKNKIIRYDHISPKCSKNKPAHWGQSFCMVHYLALPNWEELHIRTIILQNHLCPHMKACVRCHGIRLQSNQGPNPSTKKLQRALFCCVISAKNREMFAWYHFTRFTNQFLLALSTTMTMIATHKFKNWKRSNRKIKRNGCGDLFFWKYAADHCSKRTAVGKAGR